MSTDPGGLEDYLGQAVVIDTNSPYIIIGKLVAIHREYLTLDDCDVHDTTTATSTKDQYIMEANRLGVCTNRGQAKVRLDVVISVSPLKDVITF